VRAWTIIAGLAGAIFAGILIWQTGISSIARTLSGAGVGIAWVIPIHAVQLLLTALGWRPLIPRGQAARSIVGLTLVRVIREGVNTLLPTAQVGGLVIAVRLLTRRGLGLADAVAATVVDVTVELATQIAFTLIGIALLLYLLGALAVAVPVMAGLGIMAAMALALVAVQRLGVAGFAIRIAGRFGWMQQVEGLQQAISGMYRRRAMLAQSAAWHLLAWSLGAAEVSCALHFLGRDTPLDQGFVIESLGQSVKAASFAIPSALGVQEGGYVIICGLFGISPDIALALSIVKRLRDLVFGAPSIAAWLHLERSAASRSPVTSQQRMLS
jgi:putative membrane protein